MSKPYELPEPETSIPQFDRAEFAPESSGGPTCRECRRALEDEYYDVSGSVVCPACLEKWGRTRSRMMRGLKALLLGSLAAAVGAAIYRTIMVGTGWNFSLVAILVGYMVGGAVRTGSRDRGGRLYQFLAIFLTYSALVGMFAPDVWKALSSLPRTRKPEARPVAVVAGAALQAAIDPSPDAGDKEARPKAAAEEPPPLSILGLLYLLGMVLLLLLMLVGFMYYVPLYVGLHSPISLLIFGFGLWEAWRINRPSEVNVTGPYRVCR